LRSSTSQQGPGVIHLAVLFITSFLNSPPPRQDPTVAERHDVAGEDDNWPPHS